ncbi:hypothetical protein [Phormidesmis priestleyi]
MKISQLSFCILGGCLLIAQAVQADKPVSPQTSITKIPTLNEVERPITSAKQLLVQNSAQAAQITSIQLNKTAAGLEVVLSTTDNTPLQASVKTDRSYQK